MPRSTRQPGRPGAAVPSSRARRPWSVRAHLWTVLAVAVVVLAASLGSGYVWSAAQAERYATSRMTDQARIAAQEITDALGLATDQVERLAAQPTLALAFEGPNDCTLVVGGGEAFPDARAALVAPDGRVGCSSEPSLVDLEVHGGSPWLAEALGAPGLTIHWPATDAVTGRRVVVVTQPIAGPSTEPNDGPTDGPSTEPAGVVAVFLDATHAATALATTQALPADAALLVVDRTGADVVSTSTPDRAGADPAAADPAPAGAAPADAPPAEAAPSDPAAPDASRVGGMGAGGTGRWAGPDGVVRTQASADVAGLPWRVVAGLEHSTVLESARGTLVRQALTGGAALLLLAAALAVLDRRVAGPLRALTSNAVRARDDAGDARVPEDGAAELVELARAYNSMLDVRAGQEARLAYQASHDRLTGLPDADWARARLDLLLSRATGPARPGVLHLGLTDFDAIATGIGPDAADRVVIEVAARLRSGVRPGDALARAAGDGFLVVCEDLTRDEAIDLAQSLHVAVGEPMGWPAPGVVVRVTAGIGLAADGPAADGSAADVSAGDGSAADGPVGDDPGDRARDGGRHAGRTADDLLRAAATALGHAQSGGRVLSVFDDSMRVRATHQLETEHRLRRALAGDELVVHYQPIVDLDSGRITGAEALVRWEDPERGLVPPLQFIPVAERSGQITAIGDLVLSRACRQAAQWQRTDHPFVMSVNVAAAQLLDDDFARCVAQVLRDTGLAPHHLCLEVTESAVVRRAGGGIENLHRLRRLGVQVAVDDFGTGYSSLSYLQHLPITSLKIDRSFITRIEHDGRDRHLVDAVLGMARALDLAVVAEGVETEGQRDLLGDLGCASAQGYLFGRPCRADDFTPLLAPGARVR
ncbi:EAL domain-containing protein [Cellulomonas sp. ATA003]|uniref:putative bifunctional diguanylate cyclase/phosphodiesterase n=1 Tax=Cellulomonas sp. ATA003 TaxID=3073064 RepID=UPI00287356F8|nr:EAL domain-containing protein [Cellulomonas sp. ATA003]WNB86870.1 EAL domain-containing protein [Cellulomonas sp. ATA003]